MIDYRLLFIFLKLEAACFLIFTVLMILHRILRNHSEKKYLFRKQKLSEYYLRLLESAETFSPDNQPGKKKWKKAILRTIEEFNERLSDEKWNSLSRIIVKQTLLRQGRIWARSIFWIHRNLGARVFQIYAETADHPILLKLIKSRSFLIKRPAFAACIAQEALPGVTALLDVMKKEEGYPRFLYRDLLLKSSRKVFEHLLTLADREEYTILILNILKAKTWGFPIPFLEKELQSPDPAVRLPALEVLQRNPLPDTNSYFEKAVRNKEIPFQLTAIEGLRLFADDSSRKILEEKLGDPAWEVRKAAAHALKGMGEQGQQILHRMKEGPAREAAQYALQFDYS